ncbi:MAG: hypothetical protein K0U78_08655 [Actinomycetia bacterium]|nr:hypothetical protein [Actinomycetes bacterium]
MGVFTSVCVGLWLLRGSYVTALVCLLVSIWGFGSCLYLLLTRYGTAKPRIDVDAEGTRLRPPKVTDTVHVIAAYAVFIAAALYLILAPLGMLDYVASGPTRGMFLAGCAYLAVRGVNTAYLMLKYRGGGHLRLDPAGFEVWSGQWGSLQRGTWDAVEQILDHRLKGFKPTNEVIVFVLPQGRSAMLIADAITPNSRALREWVRFYWQHPECRGELVDGRAVRRLDEENNTA